MSRSMQKTTYLPENNMGQNQSIINIISLKNPSLNKSVPLTQNKAKRR